MSYALIFLKDTFSYKDINEIKHEIKSNFEVQIEVNEYHFKLFGM